MNGMENMNEMTKYLMGIASCVNNYCDCLKRDMGDYAGILGIVFRVYQDKIKGLSPQGIALILMNLKEVNEKDYGRYIDTYKDKVDDIIKSSKTVDEQMDKMNKIKVK